MNRIKGLYRLMGNYISLVFNIICTAILFCLNVISNLLIEVIAFFYSAKVFLYIVLWFLILSIYIGIHNNMGFSVINYLSKTVRFIFSGTFLYGSNIITVLMCAGFAFIALVLFRFIFIPVAKALFGIEEQYIKAKKNIKNIHRNIQLNLHLIKTGVLLDSVGQFETFNTNYWWNVQKQNPRFKHSSHPGRI